MKKKSENQFIEKFSLLNSQATSEEISWSFSDSSGYEDLQCDPLLNITNCISRKRKRVTKRRKDHRNVSNLNITIVDTVHERKDQALSKKSPISNEKSDFIHKSPILTVSEQCLPRFAGSTRTNKTPVKSFTRCDSPKEEKNTLSPIIHLKHEAPKISPKVRKKLFEKTSGTKNKKIRSSEVTHNTLHNTIGYNEDCLDGRKVINNISYTKMGACNDRNHNERDPSSKTITEECNNYLNRQLSAIDVKKKLNEYTEHQKKEISIISTDSSSEDGTVDRKKSCAHLISKVNSYFNSYFSSQGSQHSISECETTTPSSKENSDDLEIVNIITQVKNITSSLNAVQTAMSFESDINTGKSKKVKYKKGGIGHRLNELLKKQNASVSLWLHERYMAANSNFVIPKEEYLAFRIVNVCFKYNIYLLKVTNIIDECYLVIINGIYVHNTFFKSEDVLKVYEPYKIIDCDSACKVIVNVCKFECRKLK